MPADELFMRAQVFVAASQANAVISSKKGSTIKRFIIVPATLSPGAITFREGTGTDRTLFTGGASSLTELKPIVVDFGGTCAGDGYQITTGANVSVIVIGNFNPQ